MLLHIIILLLGIFAGTGFGSQEDVLNNVHSVEKRKTHLRQKYHLPTLKSNKYFLKKEVSSENESELLRNQIKKGGKSAVKGMKHNINSVDIKHSAGAVSSVFEKIDSLFLRDLEEHQDLHHDPVDSLHLRRRNEIKKRDDGNLLPLAHRSEYLLKGAKRHNNHYDETMLQRGDTHRELDFDEQCLLTEGPFPLNEQREALKFLQDQTLNKAMRLYMEINNDLPFNDVGNLDVDALRTWYTEHKRLVYQNFPEHAAHPMVPNNAEIDNWFQRHKDPSAPRFLARDYCPSWLAKFGLMPQHFRTVKNEAVFWSTRQDHDGNSCNKNMVAAQDWARKKGKKTLEMTKGGKILNELGMFNRDNYRCDQNRQSASYTISRDTIQEKLSEAQIPYAGLQENIMLVGGIVGGTVQLDQAGYTMNCASYYFAMFAANAAEANGVVHAFFENPSIATVFTPREDSRNYNPTFFNMEMPTMLQFNPDIKAVFHYTKMKKQTNNRGGFSFEGDDGNGDYVYWCAEVAKVEEVPDVATQESTYGVPLKYTLTRFMNRNTDAAARVYPNYDFGEAFVTSVPAASDNGVEWIRSCIVTALAAVDSCSLTGQTACRPCANGAGCCDVEGPVITLDQVIEQYRSGIVDNR